MALTSPDELLGEGNCKRVGWKTVLQIASSQVMRCCEAVRGALKTSLKRRGAYSSRQRPAAPAGSTHHVARAACSSEESSGPFS